MVLALVVCACAGATSPRVTAAATAVRAGGINVEPSYRPWRYMTAPNPDGWWCDPSIFCTSQMTSNPMTEVNNELTLIKALGVANLRLEFPWTWIQPSSTCCDWTRADAIVAAANAHGVVLQPIIVFTPLWANAAGDSRNPPSSATVFPGFVTALVNRYKSSIHVWEMWNEPDLSGNYWSAGEQAYVTDILVPGYNAVKAADPTALVELGAPSTANSSWLNAIYTDGGGNSFDIISYHDYSSLALADSSTVYNVLVGHGQTSKPVWLGEYGTQENAISDTNQQSLMTSVLTTSANLAMAQWYNLRDDQTWSCCPWTNVHPPEQYFGIVQIDGATKKNGYGLMQSLLSGSSQPLTASGSEGTVNGLSVNFTGSATGGVAPYVFSWNFGDGSTSSQQNPSHTYGGGGSYAVNLTVTDSAAHIATSSLTVTLSTRIAGQSKAPSSLPPRTLPTNQSPAGPTPSPIRLPVIFGGLAILAAIPGAQQGLLGSSFRLVLADMLAIEQALRALFIPQAFLAP